MVTPKSSAPLSPPALLRQVASAYREAPQIGKEKKLPDWELVEQYLPLLKSIVSRMRIYFPSQMDIQDIYSIAIAGLIHAAQHFDLRKGAYFGKYASMRIRGALLDELRRMDLMPRSDRLKVKKYQSQVQALEQELNRAVSAEEVQEGLSLSKSQYERLQEKCRPICHIPLDYSPTSGSAYTGESGWSFHDLIFDPTDLDGRDVAERKDLLKILRRHLDDLPEVAREVLILYYIRDLNLAEIAQVFDLTESRICQIHTQAIQTLRKLVKKSLSA